jgi:hypothetical protein
MCRVRNRITSGRCTDLLQGHSFGQVCPRNQKVTGAGQRDGPIGFLARLFIPSPGLKVGEHARLDCSVLRLRIGQRCDAPALVGKLLTLDRRHRFDLIAGQAGQQRGEALTDSGAKLSCALEGVRAGFQVSGVRGGG